MQETRLELATVVELTKVVAAEVIITKPQVEAQAVLALLLLAILVLNVALVALSLRQAVTQFTHSHLQGHTQHESLR
jgi:hypothetical protein